MADILSTAVIEVIRHLCETQQEDKVWLQNYLLAACDTIDALRAEVDELRCVLRDIVHDDGSHLSEASCIQIDKTLGVKAALALELNMRDNKALSATPPEEMS